MLFTSLPASCDWIANWIVLELTGNAVIRNLDNDNGSSPETHVNTDTDPGTSSPVDSDLDVNIEPLCRDVQNA